MLALLLLTAGDLPPLSPAATAAVARWHAAVADERARQAELPPPTTPAERIGRMVELDQAARSAFGMIMQDSAVSAAEKPFALGTAWQTLAAIDAEHTAQLKALVPASGWFKISEVGEKQAHGAWLLLQHSPDHAFMERVLAAMTPLVRQREVLPFDYARLFDRVADQAKRPQRYGTQATCRAPANRWIIDKLADPEHVEARRKAIGWTESFAATLVRLKIGKPCV